MIMERLFYTILEKETPEVVGSVMVISCSIGKDIARYVLKTPHSIINTLISKLILTVPRPIDLRLVYLSYAVWSAVMLFFICCMQ